MAKKLKRPSSFDNLSLLVRRERSKLYEYKGESFTISQWANKLGIPYIALYQYLIKFNWDVEKLFDFFVATHLYVPRLDIPEILEVVEEPNIPEIEEDKEVLQEVEILSKPKILKNRSKVYTYEGESLNLLHWSQKTGIQQSTLYQRLHKFHWSFERAITTPVIHKILEIIEEPELVDIKSDEESSTELKLIEVPEILEEIKEEVFEEPNEIEEPVVSTNKKQRKLYEYEGVRLNLGQWSKKLGVDYGVLYQRVHNLNWSFEKVIIVSLASKNVDEVSDIIEPVEPIEELKSVEVEEVQEVEDVEELKSVEVEEVQEVEEGLINTDIYVITSDTKNSIIGKNLFMIISDIIYSDDAFEKLLFCNDRDDIDKFLGLDYNFSREDDLVNHEKMLRKGYRFNFKQLEDKVNLYYKTIRLYESDISSNKYKISLVMFYKSVTDLVFGVFSVNPPNCFAKYSIDSYDEACSYALYLTDRVRLHSIDWSCDKRNAWTQYIRLNTRYVYSSLPLFKTRELSFDKLLDELDKKLTYDSIEDIDTLLPNPVVYQDLSGMTQKEFFSKLIILLKVYYPENVIYRLLPITFSSMTHKFKLPDDVKQFKCALVVNVKRLVDYYSDSPDISKINLDQSIDKSIIILILLSYLSSNSEFSSIPFKLVSALDFHNLVRLATVAGGETITIPTVDDLELMVGSCIALSAMLFDGVDAGESRYVAKRFLGLKKDVRKLNKFMRDMFDGMNTNALNLVLDLNSSKGESFVCDLVSHLKAITKHQTNILTQLEEDIPNLTSEELINSLASLDGSEKKLVGLLERIAFKNSGVPE